MTPMHQISIIMICNMIVCFLSTVVLAQPVFNIPHEDRMESYFYLLNCADKYSELRVRNGIYFLQIPVILISKDRRYARAYDRDFETVYYAYSKGTFRRVFSNLTKMPQLHIFNKISTVDLCDFFNVRLKSSLLKKYYIHFLSISRSEFDAINIVNLRIGKESNNNMLLEQDDLENFSFDIFQVDGMEIRKLNVSSPCFDDRGYAYYSFNNHQCHELLNQYLGRDSKKKDNDYFHSTSISDSTIAKQKWPTTTTTIWTTTTTTSTTTTTTIPIYKNNAKSTTIDNEDIYPNFGYIVFNASITQSKITKKVSYIAFLTASDSEPIKFSPIKKKLNKLHFYQPEKTNIYKIAYLFNSEMDLVGKYDTNKKQCYTTKRFGDIISKEVFLDALKRKNQILNSISMFNTDYQSIFTKNGKMNEAIESVKKILKNGNQYLGFDNFYAKEKTHGNYVFEEKYYLQKISTTWVLKDYQNLNAPLCFVLPKSNIQYTGTFYTILNKPIHYTKTVIYDSNDYIYDIKDNQLTFVAGKINFKRILLNAQ